MKILDYFAAAIPVVSTSKGAEGLGLSDGDQALIRDGHADFSEAVAELLLNPEKARRIAELGRQHVVRFDWSQIARAYLRLYSACRSP
jgi:glycosyltransferase involved in cell wall biosynthesis